MSIGSFIELAELLATRLGTVDPRLFPAETFDYYSIPAYDTGRAELVSGREIGSAKQILQPDDVLLSRIVPHIRRAWVVGQSKGHRIIGSGEWIVFRSTRIYPPFLRHLLTSDSFHPEFMRTVSGVGGSLLRARPATVAKIKIKLPPLNEQQNIATILDQAEALRAKRSSALTKLDTLTQSLFLEMFGDPVNNDKAWPFGMVGNIVSHFETGKSISAPDGGSASSYRILKISAVTNRRFAPNESKPLPLDFTPTGKDRVRAGDLLFSRANTTELVGATAYVFSAPKNLILPDKIWRFVWKDPIAAVPLYVWHLFSQLSFRREMSKRASGTSGSMKNISQDKVLNLKTILPPADLQRRFAASVRQIEVMRSAALAGC